MPRATANGIELEYQATGEDGAEPVLLIMGLGAQLTRWPDAFVERLASRGFKVIRFDNPDVGLSTKLDAAGLPDFAALFQALREGRTPKAPYLLDDMAADTVGPLDAFRIDRAHIVGGSLGGMIAQLVAADYPQRTLSLTSIMSRKGSSRMISSSTARRRTARRIRRSALTEFAQTFFRRDEINSERSSGTSSRTGPSPKCRPSVAHEYLEH